MCTGVEIAMLTMAAGGAAASAASALKSPAPPPAAVTPAAPAPTAREAGAQVKVGDDPNATKNEPTAEYAGFSEKRSSGKTLGGLGRGGLGL